MKRLKIAMVTFLLGKLQENIIPLVIGVMILVAAQSYWSHTYDGSGTYKT